MHTEHIGSCRAERFCFFAESSRFCRTQEKPVKKLKIFFPKAFSVIKFD